MNYQKLFSRFYSSGEQTNGEIIQKYAGFSGNGPNFPGMSSEEVSSGGVLVENQVDRAEFLEYQSRIQHEEDEVMFVNQVPCENTASQSWEIPSPEDTLGIVEPLAPEEVHNTFISTPFVCTQMLNL